MFDLSFFAKSYAVVLMGGVGAIVLVLFLRDCRNKIIKLDVIKNGCHTQAEILTLESHTGKISQYTNIKMIYQFHTVAGETIDGVGSAVVFTSEIQCYYPGNHFSVIYSRKNPRHVIIKIPNASLHKSPLTINKT